MDRPPTSESSEVLTTFLASADGADARCPSCGYRLRGCTSTRCPECGAELRLEVARASGTPGLSGWWLAGLLGLAMTTWLVFRLLSPPLQTAIAATGKPQLRQMVAAGYATSSDLPDWPRLFTLTAALIVCLGLVAVLIATRRQFAAMPPVRRALCGGALLASPLILIGCLAVLA